MPGRHLLIGLLVFPKNHILFGFTLEINRAQFNGNGFSRHISILPGHQETGQYVFYETGVNVPLAST